MKEFLGVKLKSKDEPEGEFEPINMEYKFDWVIWVKYSLRIYFDFLCVDLNGVLKSKDYQNKNVYICVYHKCYFIIFSVIVFSYV